MNRERQLLESLLDRKQDEFEDALAALGDRRGFEVLTLGFTAAAFRQFPENTTTADVARYVHDLRERLPEGDQLKPMPTEAALRSVLGRPEAVEGVPMPDVVAAQVVVIRAVASDHDLVGQAREDFLREVLEALS